MRDSEIRGLRWADIDFDGGMLTVSGQMAYMNGALVRVSTKTEASERTLPISDAVAGVLRAHRARQNKERLRAGNLWADGDYVFTRTDGQVLTPIGRRLHWLALREQLGLGDIRFHDLRHTAATHMLAYGSPVKVIQATLGHSAFRTTMDLYAHTLPEGMRANADAMAGLISGQAG